MDDKNVNFYKGKSKKIVDEQFIKNEMAQYLQVENLNFLIGAGCSSHVLDGIEMGIPGMRSLYEDFFDINPDFKIASENVKDKFDKNLEKMLECLGAVNVANQIKEIDCQILDKIQLVQNFIREKIIEGISGSDVTEFYRDFYLKTVRNGRATPINIFTTNYDLYNERALDSLAFPYNNGFVGTYNRVFSPSSYKFAYVEDMNLSNDVWERVPNFYNLYKLHGSITWVNREQQIQEIDYKHISEGETVMIYPTPLKDRTTLMTPYSDLFRTMETSLLKRNSILVTMGYSFSDDHINRLILNSLAIPSFRLVIFGNSDSIDKLISLNDSRIIVINSEDNIHYFSNIVNKAMPDLQDDIKEQISIPKVTEILKALEGDINE